MPTAKVPVEKASTKSPLERKRLNKDAASVKEESLQMEKTVSDSFWRHITISSIFEVYCAGHVPTPGPHDPIPHRSNLLYSPKTKGEYPYNLMRPSGP
ncbi:unnamed protein product [Gongylonema pulchrum]|uniref:Uncharacterized protein n=1 Tax=Gongylonema pulchrum TaxID=637853 RepID=A0A183EAX1_9BILA|nr:unnamed protein product [Gongylonema pulchrum]